MKQVASTLRIITLVTICVCVATACISERSKQAQLKAFVDEMEKEMKATSFLTTFYQDFEQAFDEGGDYDECLRQNVTPNAEQWFKDKYDYDCADDNCMASWLLLYDITDPGTLQERNIEPIDANTCKVVMTYDRGNGEMYEYVLKISIVNEGEGFKIDSIEIENSRTYEA